MHQRKARMAELSDAVIMLPGGFGTYEEFMETVTWVHLGIHDKPCGVLNADGFFDHLLTFLAQAVDLGLSLRSWSSPWSSPMIPRSSSMRVVESGDEPRSPESQLILPTHR